MNLTTQSGWLFILLLVPIFLFFYAVFYTTKEKKGLDIFLKPITLILFTIVLFFTYRIGLIEEGTYTSNHSINFVAITAAIKVYTGEYRGDIVEVATNNRMYVTLLYTASITGFMFVFYAVFGVIIRLMTNNMRLRYYKGCKNIYLFGNDDKINTFIKSLEPKPHKYFYWFLHIKQSIKFFFPWCTKLIVVMPKDKEGKLIITASSIKPAFIYADVTNSILQSIILTTNKREQTIISLYEEDDVNAKLIGSINNLIDKEYTHYRNQVDPNQKINYKQNWKEYHTFLYFIEHKHDPIVKQDIRSWWRKHHQISNETIKNYTEEDLEKEFQDAIQTIRKLFKKINKHIAKYEKTKLNLNAHIHFMDLDSLNMLETRMNLKNRVDFYSQNSMVAYQYAFDHPIMEYQMEGKKSIHYVLVGFGLTNRNILRYLMVNNVISNMKRTYTCISNDKKNTLDHFEQKINIKEFYEKLDSKKQDSYLPRIELPSTLGTYQFKPKIDVTKKEFIKYLDELHLEKEDQVVFIVALGKDIRNIDIGHKLYEYAKQRKILEHTQIDLRIIDDELDITPLFGNELDTVNSFGKYKDVYVYDNIIAKDYLVLAKGIHKGLGFYNSPFDTESHMSRLSSLYAALSIRNKLLYLGFDLTKDSKQEILDTEYYKAYLELKDNTTNLEQEITSLRETFVPLEDSKHANKYYPPGNMIVKRHMLAILEHDRWNAFKILDGTVPMSLDTLLHNMEDPDHKGNPGKNESDNTHICLTTRTGLVMLLEAMHKKNQELVNNGVLKEGDEYSIDKILLDYSAMDNLPIVLENSDYYICKAGKGK